MIRADVRSGYVAAKRALIGPPLRDTKHDSALAAYRIHHRSHIVHTLLQGRDTSHPVREPSSPLVQEDEPREGCEALHKPDNRWCFPVMLEVRNKAGHEHHVEGTVAKHLIGDVSIVASGVSDLWREHLSSLTIYPLLSLQRTSLTRWQIDAP